MTEETLLMYCHYSLCQAISLLDEMRQGYPEHFFLVVGHLAAAACDIVFIDEDIAASIRQARLSLYSNRSSVPDIQSIAYDVQEKIAAINNSYEH